MEATSRRSESTSARPSRALHCSRAPSSSPELIRTAPRARCSPERCRPARARARVVSAPIQVLSTRRERMSSEKKRRKARRETYRNMEEAWKAWERGDRALADKLSERALAMGFVNPRVWLERAAMLEAMGDRERARLAYARALEM